MANTKGSKKTSSVAEQYVPSVRVRMFRQGLGDCFLITFDVGGDERHMLIDCGTLGNKYTDVDIDDVAEHILDLLEPDGRLDLLVVTHEHQDHVSGFRNKTLRQLKGKVDRVWLAWTENPKDQDAQKLAKTKHDLGMALATIVEAQPLAEVSEHVRDLLSFAGDVSAGPAAFGKTVDEAMDFVRKELGARVTYRAPPEMVQEEWLPGFRFYVLGPPRDATLLKQLGEHGSEHLYGLQRAAELHAAANDAWPSVEDAEKRAALELEQPFDQQYCWDLNQHQASQYPEYSDPNNQWRAIENDWLGITSELALQLDSLTNNTSLALAIERIVDGKVLLFPADAQLGSWLSWHGPKMTWSIHDDSGNRQNVTAADLMHRTVFYKVGHHSSHNATAREKGLEMMKADELTAFIPVDRAVALSRNPKGSWQMPAPLLYRSLLEKCQGRVARSDLGWARKPRPDQKTESQFADLASDAEWKKWESAQNAAGHIKIRNLYVDYLLE